jgi:PKD repeat protein
VLRNSWGNKWGDRGYMRIAYGANLIGSESAKAVYGSNPPINSPPIPSAGPAQMVRSFDTVTLDGSGSRDTDGSITRYAWVPPSGSSVTLTLPSTAKPTFVAPLVTSATPLVFSLTVTDNAGASATASVTITVKPENRPPVANAGPAQTVLFGADVTLDGSASSDPDGTIILFGWSFGDGAQGSGPTPTHAYSSAGVYTVVLHVIDDDGAVVSCSTIAEIGATPVEPSTWGHIKSQYRD